MTTVMKKMPRREAGFVNPGHQFSAPATIESAVQRDPGYLTLLRPVCAPVNPESATNQGAERIGDLPVVWHTDLAGTKGNASTAATIEALDLR